MARRIVVCRIEPRRLTSKFLDYGLFLQHSESIDMKLKDRNVAFAPKNKAVRVGSMKAMLLGLLVLSCTVKAQQVISPPPLSADSEPIAQQTETNAFQVFKPEENAFNASDSQPFKWGPVTARPHLLYRLLYGSGIQPSPSNHQDTAIHEISPGIVFDIGTHWALDYTPTLRYYSNNHFKDEFDNSVSLSGGAAYEDWRFGLSQSYASSSSPQAETGSQTDEENYSTALTASYAFNSKMSVDVSVNQNLDFVDNPLTSTNSAPNVQKTYTWSTTEWLNYEFWPRLNAGIGAGFGYVNVNIGPNQTFEQLQGRVNWRATDKISFSINAGFEDRQFLSSGSGNLLNPLFGASIQYQPFEQTQISLSASRVVSASSLFALASVTVTTGVNLDLNQRLFGKYYLDLGAGYSTVKYTDSISTGSSTFSGDRVDDDYTFNARLSRSFLKRGTVAVTYQYSDNSSTLPGFSYSSSQIGFEIGYSY
jgi:hypothetical protein